MGFTYTITETETENFPDGIYICELKSVEDKMYSYNNQMVSYVSVCWEILMPTQYVGCKIYEKFYTGHFDQKRSNRAKWQLSTLCKQIAGLRTGETIAEEHLIGKRAELSLQNNTADNGKTYQNIIKRSVVTSISKHEASQNAQSSVLYGNINIPAQDNYPLKGIAGSGKEPLKPSENVPLNDAINF